MFIHLTESGLCTRECGWLRAKPPWSQTVTQQITSLVLICDAKTWSHKKEEKLNAVSVLNVLATGLSLCAEQRVDFVQELWVTVELIHKGVSFTQQISSLVLICDAKTWSHKKEEKELQWVSWIFWPLDCLYMLNREWTLYKRIWVTKSQPTLASDCHSTNLFSSLNLWCKDLVPQKRGKGIAVSDLNILATELSLYAEQRVDFVKEFAY